MRSNASGWRKSSSGGSVIFVVLVKKSCRIYGYMNQSPGTPELRRPESGVRIRESRVRLSLDCCDTYLHVAVDNIFVDFLSRPCWQTAMNGLIRSTLIHVIVFCQIAATDSFALQPISKTYTLDVLRFNATRRGDEEINAFYKQMKYRKPPLAKLGDTQYTLRGDFIAATVRLSSDSDSGWMFLRNLCVNSACRRQGLALYLLGLVLDDFSQTNSGNKSGVYCFLEPTLSPLYTKAGLWESTQTLPKSIFHRWMKLKARAKAEDLRCFQWHALNIILLQHSKECHRKTGTAHLLSGTRHLKVRKLVWSGRSDNEAVQMMLNEYQGDNIVLLWTGSVRSPPTVSSGSVTSHFLLLDGTWQEAKSMFRKIPELQRLERLSLSASAPSMYTLRQNFGWRERFSDNGDHTLLCTAEVGAELLHHLGNEPGATHVRSRLMYFQDMLVD